MFKVGDRVRLINDANNGGVEVGSIGVVDDFIDTMMYIKFPKNSSWGIDKSGEYNNIKCIEKVDYKMEDLQQGDKVLDDDGDARTVLARVGCLVALSMWHAEHQNRFSDWYTTEELDLKGFKLPTQEDEITEFTLDEIAKLAGVDVSKIRIKE